MQIEIVWMYCHVVCCVTTFRKYLLPESRKLNAADYCEKSPYRPR